MDGRDYPSGDGFEDGPAIRGQLDYRDLSL
jgi:hypothetical protein